ncbi:MAG: Na(+)/H(+) antiporter subunit D [Proteobacteria bacterium]|nr:Na(+)/H(+) antiporter subunit D [Pseudomonadota bacterium]
MTPELPPFLILVAGALVAPLVRGRLQSAFLLALPALSLVNLLGLQTGSEWTIGVAGLDLCIYRIDRLNLLFGYLFHLGAVVAILYSLHVKDDLQHASGLIYAGSGMGAIFAGDLLTLFLFWELLAVSSVFLIWARRTDRAYRAGLRYLVIQVASGVTLLAGVVLRFDPQSPSDSLALDQFLTAGMHPHAVVDDLGGALILGAVGLKCAFPLLHNWIPDAYPEATPTGTLWMSSFTTKVAVYALARLFPGCELLAVGEGVKALIYVGAVMTMFPIFYAVIENDLRRVLGYSMINQIGFMVVGVGLGSELAINGAVAHAFNDVFFKGLLFMSMGAILHRTGEIRASELGALYKSMPATTVFCLIGAASISAFPLFSGFVSKTMVMAAALDEGHPWLWLVLLFASAGVLHHAGIKIPYWGFFAHDHGLRCKEAPLNMLIAMGLASVLCVAAGCFPHQTLYTLLPYEAHYDPYTVSHVVSQLQLVLFAVLAFAWMELRGLEAPELRSTNLDFDWVYRRVAAVPLLLAGRITAGLIEVAREGVFDASRYYARHLDAHYGPRGLLGEPWHTGASAFWTAALLGVYLLFSYW